MRRDDQLFLDDASSHMHDEQTELLTKVNGLRSRCACLLSGRGYFCWGSWRCGSTRS
jgi:hypothetical protein